MAELFDYMSWNIESFSEKHAQKMLFRNIEVAYWIAKLFLEMQANVIGVMEITLGTGDIACNILCNTLNNFFSGTLPWKVEISDRNVSKDSKVAKRADKYAVFYDSRRVNIQNLQLKGDDKIDFADRVPLYWETVAPGVTVNCLLWHAPQPKYHQKAQTMQLLADLATNIMTSSKNPMLISGDFNYNTGSAAVYAPLTNLGFDGLFNGQRTTLTSIITFMKDSKNRQQMVAQGDYDDAFLASCYDNVFIKGITSTYDIKICVPYVVLSEIQQNVNFQIITRLQLQNAMQNAKLISDHMPLVLTING